MAKMRIDIPNRLTALAEVARCVDEFAAANQLSRSAASDLNVALDEVLNNTVSYGYADDREHTISIRLDVEGDTVVATVVDDGRPFDPLKAPAPDLEGSVAERKVGGVGLHFVRSLMTRCEYRREGGHNVLKLVRKRD